MSFRLTNIKDQIYQALKNVFLPSDESRPPLSDIEDIYSETDVECGSIGKQCVDVVLDKDTL